MIRVQFDNFTTPTENFQILEITLQRESRIITKCDVKFIENFSSSEIIKKYSK